MNTIKKYVSEGNDVYLYSFCEHEGDELIVEKISKEFANCENVKYIKYDGDIEKFLEIYSKMEYMICARFHAMILSCIARQKMFVMSYSLKIDNVIKDLELNLPTLHFDEINKEILPDKKEFRTVDEKRILQIIEHSKEQDKIFEKSILKKQKN